MILYERPLLCVHGHFYQPPREDPWTGLIPKEAGAEPYPNFNAKITAECYRPNAELHNFARISFDLGPTLASWLEREEPDVYRSIQEQARAEEPAAGNALAQAYSHRILPLATRRDKATQVRWSIADFAHRFGYTPRGMWLPETAVDLETLDVLAENEIEFTVLAPWQAAVKDVDVRRPYRVQLANGQSIVAFFYDAALSGDVSFNAEATIDAAAFAVHRVAKHDDSEAWDTWTDVAPPLTLIATDGEFYGHHQPDREHFLHALLYGEALRAGLDVTFLSGYLDRYGATAEIGIEERTSWSCHHGIARWSTGCDCTRGDSSWKAVAFEALTALTEELDATYERAAGELLRDPWDARDKYIEVLLGETPLDDFIAAHAARPLSEPERQRARDLLRGQLYSQRMHTSCGFFWDDLARLEMRNNLAYAAQAIRCIEKATGTNLEAGFRERLRTARSEGTGLAGDEVFVTAQA
jgi:alpha-amylase/alpha-mannosidase (GH57 family)